MSAGVSVAASGSALAFLLYENVNSVNNQAGYLIGDIVSEKKNLISDEHFENEKTETVIHIHSVKEVKALSLYYSLANCEEVKNDATGVKSRTIVGWYSFKRNVTPVPTFHDHQLHTQLLKLFGRSPEHFLFCLLSSSENSDNETHSFRQHMLVYNPLLRKYDSLPLLIENLANISPHYRGKLPPSSGQIMQSLMEKSWNILNESELADKWNSRFSNELNVAIKTLLCSQTELERKKEILSQLRHERDKLLQRRNDAVLGQSRLAQLESMETVSGRAKATTTAYRQRYMETPRSWLNFPPRHPFQLHPSSTPPGYRPESFLQVNSPKPSVATITSSDDVISLSDDESSTSPVLGSTTKRSCLNRL